MLPHLPSCCCCWRSRASTMAAALTCAESCWPPWPCSLSGDTGGPTGRRLGGDGALGRAAVSPALVDARAAAAAAAAVSAAASLGALGVTYQGRTNLLHNTNDSNGVIILPSACHGGKAGAGQQPYWAPAAAADAVLSGSSRGSGPSAAGCLCCCCCCCQKVCSVLRCCCCRCCCC